MDNQKEKKYIVIRNITKKIDISEIITFFFQFRTDIKMFHWQTKLYAYHKVSDELLENVDSLSDKLIEALLGKLEKRPNINNNVSIRNMDEKIFNELLDRASNYLLEGFCNIEFPEILNIRDEILGEIDKAKYLLTFE